VQHLRVIALLCVGLSDHGRRRPLLHGSTPMHPVPRLLRHMSHKPVKRGAGQRKVRLAYARGTAIRFSLRDAISVYAPSAIPFSDTYPLPKEMSVEDMNTITDAHISAIERCKAIGCESN
jgi:hypothetical protein